MTKTKKCAICKNNFTQKHSLEKVCSIRCAINYASKIRKKKHAIELKVARENLKTRGDYLKEAQIEFNKFIRLRDKNLLCISCQKPPKKRNAGHYRSVGACPELRFEELNCHMQCEHCNTYLSGNLIEYRKNLILKIGVEKVEFLESKHEPKKYTIDEIKEIKAKYKQKLKGLI